MEVDSGECVTVSGEETYGKISLLSPQFCCEPKTILNNKVYLFRKKFFKYLNNFVKRFTSEC